VAADGSGNATRVVLRLLWPLLRPVFRRNMGTDPEQVAAALRRLSVHFDLLESEIGSSGYLVGDAFTIADLSAAAVMTAIIRPPEFSYPLPEPWPPALVELRGGVADRPGFRWVMEMYRRHRGQSFEIP
jgi:glutathione S-transferase